jgi:hypothetical protein
MLTIWNLGELSMAAFAIATAAEDQAKQTSSAAEAIPLIAFAGRARALAIEASEKALALPRQGGA